MRNLRGKKVLITGASGFLGSYLARECHAQGAELYGIDIKAPNSKHWNVFLECNVEAEAVHNMFKENIFDLIFHLAGGASVGESVSNPSRDFNLLLPPTLRLILLVREFCPETHFVLFSSAAVYGNPLRLPVKECDPVNPVSPYGIHKVLVEELLKFYSGFIGFRCSVLRVFSAYGEGLRKQLFWDVMNKYQKEVNQKPGKQVINIDLFGTGNESRDFIHAIDIAKCAVIIANNKPMEKGNFDVFNLANEEEVKIYEAIDCLFSTANPKPDVNFIGTNRKGDPENWKGSIEKIKALGYSKSISLTEGLSNYHNWFLLNSNN